MDDKRSPRRRPPESPPGAESWTWEVLAVGALVVVSALSVLLFGLLR